MLSCQGAPNLPSNAPKVSRLVYTCNLQEPSKMVRFKNRYLVVELLWKSHRSDDTLSEFVA